MEKSIKLVFLVSNNELCQTSRLFFQWHLIVCTVHVGCCEVFSVYFCENNLNWFYGPIRFGFIDECIEVSCV